MVPLLSWFFGLSVLGGFVLLCVGGRFVVVYWFGFFLPSCNVSIVHSLLESSFTPR